MSLITKQVYHEDASTTSGATVSLEQMTPRGATALWTILKIENAAGAIACSFGVHAKMPGLDSWHNWSSSSAQLTTDGEVGILLTPFIADKSIGSLDEQVRAEMPVPPIWRIQMFDTSGVAKDFDVRCVYFF